MENLDEHQIFQKIAKKLYNSVNQFRIMDYFRSEEFIETDLTGISAQNIIEKINNHQKQNPSDINSLLFLNYLRQFPASMCRHEISPLLTLIIGFHYRMSIPTEAQAKEGLEKISYDDLAQIFCRSKATISDCIKKTEIRWLQFQQEMQKQTENEITDPKTPELMPALTIS